MSQSRGRKPQGVGVDIGSKARTSAVKASGDSAPSAPHQHQVKHNQSSRNKNKIPKSIRYDLENALVGLCDVWFEDIKPHLVRNKIKLHVDTNGATASGDFTRLPPAKPGCSHRDPGAASDRHQQTYANSAAYSSTQPTASKARYRRPPAPLPPPPLRPLPFSPPTLSDWTSQNKNSKSKSPPRTGCPRKTDIFPSPPNRRVPRLCRTYSLQSPEVTPRARVRRIQTATPVPHSRKESCARQFLGELPSTRNKYTQTDFIPFKTKSPPRYKSIFRTNTEPSPDYTNPVPLKRKQHDIIIKNKEAVSSNTPVVQRQRRTRSNMGKVESLPRNPNPVTRQNTQHLYGDHFMDWKVTSKSTINIDQIKLAKGPASSIPNPNPRYRSREKRRNQNSAPQQKRRTVEMNVDPSISLRPPEKRELSSVPPVPQRIHSPVTESKGRFLRSFATTNLNTAKKKESQKNRIQPEIDQSTLFDKDLIEIIGAKNDKRLRVLYKSPTREEFPSVMNLISSPCDLVIETSGRKKTLPWR